MATLSERERSEIAALLEYAVEWPERQAVTTRPPITV